MSGLPKRNGIVVISTGMQVLKGMEAMTPPARSTGHGGAGPRTPFETRKPEFGGAIGRGPLA